MKQSSGRETAEQGPVDRQEKFDTLITAILDDCIDCEHTQVQADMEWLARHLEEDASLAVASDWGEVSIKNRSGSLVGAYQQVLASKSTGTIDTVGGEVIDEVLEFIENRVAESDGPARGRMAAVRFEKEGRYQDLAVAIGGFMTDWSWPETYRHNDDGWPPTIPQHLINGLVKNEVNYVIPRVVTTFFERLPDDEDKAALLIEYADKLAHQEGSSDSNLWLSPLNALHRAVEIAQQLPTSIYDFDIELEVDDKTAPPPAVKLLRKVHRLLEEKYPNLTLYREGHYDQTKEFRIVSVESIEDYF